jgi:phospholipase A1/A2
MKKIVLLMTFLIANLEALTYDDALELYTSGKYEKAFVAFKELAVEKNSAQAQYKLAKMYESGQGIQADKEEAAKWYKAAAESFQAAQESLVNQDVTENMNDVYDSLDRVEDNQTNATIYQILQSNYNITSHHTNYLLPISTRLNGSYDMPGRRATDATEVEFQVSFKYDFAPDLLGLGEIYSVAYTQHSFWQRYEDDAFFRESDYNPEIMVTLPIPLPYYKAVQFSVAHESNGLGLPYERAWNYLALRSFFQYKALFSELTFWYRMEDNRDYNPDFIDIMGYGHLKFMLPYKKHLLTLLLRNNFQGKGAIDTSYSYPIYHNSLFLYVKGFAGYGESLIDYNHYVEKIGIGVSISR